MLMHSVPQYELPEINSDSDVIVRRKRPSDKKAPKKSEPADF